MKTKLLDIDKRDRLKRQLSALWDEYYSPKGAEVSLKSPKDRAELWVRADTSKIDKLVVRAMVQPTAYETALAVAGLKLEMKQPLPDSLFQLVVAHLKGGKRPKGGRPTKWRRDTVACILIEFACRKGIRLAAGKSKTGETDSACVVVSEVLEEKAAALNDDSLNASASTLRGIYLERRQSNSLEFVVIKKLDSLGNPRS